MLPVILIFVFMVKIAATKNVTVSLGKPKSCFFIGDNVKLICAVSSESNCCGSSRFWQDNSGTNILNNGGSSDPSKYEEDYDGGTTGYNLIIKNVQKSDLGTNYTCLYRFKKDVLFLSMDYICDCSKCAGQDYGWTLLGTVIGTLIILIFAKVIKDYLGVVELKTVLIVGGLTFVISAVVDAVAIPIGKKWCHCIDGTDRLLILLGLGLYLTIGVIALICMLKQGVPTVKVQHSSYVVTTGETMTLVCTVTSRLTISSVQWERNVGDSTTTIDSNTNINKYSGSTATKPSLTILKAASSDEGTYRCFASNCVGTGQSTTIIVGSSQGSNGSNVQPSKENKTKKPAAKKRSRSSTSAAKHIKTANNETEMIPTEKGFSGDLEKKRPLPPLTNQPSPTNRPLPLPSSTKPLPSSTRPLPQITTKKGDN